MYDIYTHSEDTKSDECARLLVEAYPEDKDRVFTRKQTRKLRLVKHRRAKKRVPIDLPLRPNQRQSLGGRKKNRKQKFFRPCGDLIPEEVSHRVPRPL